MMMTRKDYIKFADAFRHATVDPEGSAVFHVTAEEMRTELIGRTADIFAADNPRFDRERFIAACKLKA